MFNVQSSLLTAGNGAVAFRHVHTNAPLVVEIEYHCCTDIHEAKNFPRKTLA